SAEGAGCPHPVVTPGRQVAPSITSSVPSPVVTYSVSVAGSCALPPGLAWVRAVGASCPQPALVWALHRATSMTETLRRCAGLAPGPLLDTKRVSVLWSIDMPSVPPGTVRAGCAWPHPSVSRALQVRASTTTTVGPSPGAELESLAKF